MRTATASRPTRTAVRGCQAAGAAAWAGSATLSPAVSNEAATRSPRGSANDERGSGARESRCSSGGYHVSSLASHHPSP